MNATAETGSGLNAGVPGQINTAAPQTDAFGRALSAFPVIIATVVLALALSLAGGDRLLKPFLWLLLLSMLVINSGTIAGKLDSLKGVIAP